MDATRRLIVIVGLVVVAAIGFVIAKASDDSSAPTTAESATTPAVVQQPATGGSTQRGTSTLKARRASAAIPKVLVRGLQPEDGVKQLVFRKGDMIRFTIVSDQFAEVHLHGYDVAVAAAPDRPATFVLPATIEGIFEVELERTGTQVATITVEP